MATKSLPEAAYLRECFDYDPETGMLTWKRRPREHFRSDHAWHCWNARFPGLEAGSRKHAGGYIHICVDDVRYKAHRVIWKMRTGEEPPQQLDHRNRIRSDNAWNNLRPATNQQNTYNGPARGSRDLPKGVYRDKRWEGSGYRTKIRAAGKTVYLGTFATPEEAHAAYCRAAREHYGEFWSPG